jgi:hypothetical protein
MTKNFNPMKNNILISLTILFASFASAQQTNTFPTNATVGIGTGSPNSTTAMHIYRNTTSTVPVLWVEDDNASGYAQMAFRGTSALFHVGVGNSSATASYQNKFFIVDANIGRPRLTIDNAGTVQIGTSLTSPAGGGKLAIYPLNADNSGLQFLRLFSTSPTVTGNGKVLSVDASGNVILVDDQQGSGTAGWSYTGNTGTNATTNFLGTTDAQDLVVKTNNAERFRVKSGGNFLVGTTTDNGKKFQVVGTSHFDGTMGIGTVNTTDANYKLFVENGIRTRKVKVDADAWPDYVFASKYKLMSLQEVEQFINENNHLPEVPSADEVQKNGIELGENQAVLLKKIEELTLYVIEQNKQLIQLKKEVAELKK